MERIGGVAFRPRDDEGIACAAVVGHEDDVNPVLRRAFDGAEETAGVAVHGPRALIGEDGGAVGLFSGASGEFFRAVAANAKLTNEFAIELTIPRRRSNHWATIVLDDSVRRPWPVKRRKPKPTLSTTIPTTAFIGPTKLKPTSTPASPSVADNATTRAPCRSMARPPRGKRNPLDPVPIR